MKKIKLISLIVGFFALFIFGNITQPVVHADVKYKINKVNVNATVNKNGSLSIKRTIYYKFNSIANGVYYQQNLNSDQKLIKPEVHISFASDPHTDFKLDKTNSEVDFPYKLSNTKEGYRFKVFVPIIDGNKLKVTYSYIITNAVINWHDIAELNYKIIGNGWKTELKHTKVTINFKKQNISKLKVWAHGPSSSYTKVNRKKRFLLI